VALAKNGGPLSSEKADARAWRKTLASMCRKVAAMDLDMDNLEEGLHELRRQVRWIPITMISLDGLVQLDPSFDPIASLAALKSDPIAESEFGKLKSSPHERMTIEASQSLYLELSRVIKAMGKVKDRGQLIEGSAHALIASGHSNPADQKGAVEAAERFLGDVGGMKAVIADAKMLQQGLVNVLLALADNLDS